MQECRMPEKITYVECKVCDFEHALHVSRATWLCPKCRRDFSLEYLFWAEVAHPEWFEEVKAITPEQWGELNLTPPAGPGA